MGAGDRAIVAPRDVVRLGLDKTKLTATDDVATSASAIAEALKIDAAAFVKSAEAAGDKAFVEAIVLRAEEATSAVPPVVRGHPRRRLARRPAGPRAVARLRGADPRQRR
ncbi:hypothetical protein [Nocardioides sp. B-3]|uniref:hypothetical protein n=1 Tax=Nocardioides sp. B-3 TaxID=2895565 RepID=UPI002152A211|nr:hypothetical protein [Nocardioides sp. B-3]UUZ61319.1 hypothetical protein LP418_12455 [Nocardioides sp. B-3]